MRRSYLVAGGLVGAVLLYGALRERLQESAQDVIRSNEQQPCSSYITAEEIAHSFLSLQRGIEERLEEDNQDTASKPTLRKPFEDLVNFLELSEEETKENIKHINLLIQRAENKWINQSRAQGTGPEREYTLDDVQRIGRHFFVYQQYQLAQTFLKENKYIVVKPRTIEPINLPSDISLLNIHTLERQLHNRFSSDCKSYDLWFPIEYEKYPELNRTRLSLKPVTDRQIDAIIEKHNNYVEELRCHKVRDYQMAYLELQKIGNDKTLAAVEKTRGFIDLCSRLCPVEIGMDLGTGLLFRKAK